MNRQQEFDNILDECLERILVRGETVEQCLGRYPELADELKPLLQTALSTKETLAIKPRPEFRDRARYQMQTALREMEEKRQRRFSLFSWQPRWATVAITALLVLVLGGGSTVAAAGNSLPDQPLYPVKLATEKVRIAVTFSRLGKAELYVQLADERVNEVIAMAEKGQIEKMEQTAERLNEQLIAMTRVVEPEEAPQALTAPPDAALEAPVPTTEEALPPEIEQAPEEEPEPSIMMAPAPLAPSPTAPPEAGVEKPGQGPEREMERMQPGPERAPLMVPEETTEPEKVQQAEEEEELDDTARLIRRVARYAREHPEELRALLQRVPEEARPALRRAIEASDMEYEKLLRYLESRGQGRDRD